ncbi:MAG: MopE-related protein [Myxococcota bacterium]|jgi:hypothetical protein|nr:MopE-related protein [Myxococcota bacterium]
MTAHWRRTAFTLLLVPSLGVFAACSSKGGGAEEHPGTDDTGTHADSHSQTQGSDTGNGTSSDSMSTSDTESGTASGTGTNTGGDTGGVDDDSDGWLAQWDCDDSDSEIYPGHSEVPSNGKDDDCDSDVDEKVDTDSETVDPYPGSVDTVFSVGSLIIPMDLDYQDQGMLKAYGLVYQLLLAHVNVYWLIKTPKEASGVDFVASAENVATQAVIPDHGYRGGPFAIAAADTLRALDVIESWWQAKHVTTVHIATAQFTGPVARILRKVPRIGIMANGKTEIISFNYMRAAGIPDSRIQQWPAAVDKTAVYEGYPDILSVAEVRGPTETNDRDGALFDAFGEPVFCELMTMHWDVVDRDEAAIAEIREYLHSPVHFFAECQSVNAVENAINGRFLTPNGYEIDTQPDEVDILNPYLPFSQLDGEFKTVGGSEPSYSLPEGDSYYDAGVVMVTAKDTPIGKQDVWMTGYLDGLCKIDDVFPTKLGGPWAPAPGLECPGKISYLGGPCLHHQDPDQHQSHHARNAVLPQCAVRG